MNFLGDIADDPDRSHIISQSELMLREGTSVSKGMNIRYDDRPSLFLMSVASHAEHLDPHTGLVVYDGHDATSAGKDRKKVDQPMYKEEGILSDNGKFFKEANAFKDGKREALEIQVYEWLDAGVWYDKGLFSLVDAQYVEEAGRKVFKFSLLPKGDLADLYGIERMIALPDKLAAWQASRGACSICGSELALHFIKDAEGCRLVCQTHTEKGSS